MANPATIPIRTGRNTEITFEPNLDPSKGAKQDAANTLLAALLEAMTAIGEGPGAVGGATAARQDAANTSLTSILAKLPTGGATAAKQDALATLLTVPVTFNAGQMKVAVTGTAVALSGPSVTLKNGVTLQANTSNVGPIVVGLVGVANVADGTGNGKVLQPGQAWAFAVSDLNILFINGTAGDWVDWSAN